METELGQASGSKAHYCSLMPSHLSPSIVCQCQPSCHSSAIPAFLHRVLGKKGLCRLKNAKPLAALSGGANISNRCRRACVLFGPWQIQQKGIESVLQRGRAPPRRPATASARRQCEDHGVRYYSLTPYNWRAQREARLILARALKRATEKEGVAACRSALKQGDEVMRGWAIIEDAYGTYHGSVSWELSGPAKPRTRLKGARIGTMAMTRGGERMRAIEDLWVENPEWGNGSNRCKQAASPVKR